MTREETIEKIKAFNPDERKITEIVIHCAATAEGKDFRARDIDAWHKKRGFRKIGYHFVVDIDGTIEEGRPLNETGAHVTGHNKSSIGICYIGGMNKAGQTADTRTAEQKDSLRFLLEQLVLQLPDVTKIAGHRDYSPDTNGNGLVDKFERIKECPCFDAIPEYADLIHKIQNEDEK